MLRTDDTAVVIIDIQRRLVAAMHQASRMVDKARKLLAAAGVLDLPIVWTEQNPRGLGPTVPELAELIPGRPIEKMTFSCCGHPPFGDELARRARPQILLAGIETHVCVYQTAMDLIADEYEVHVAADAVTSRDAEDRTVGLRKMRDAGARITTVETALFELLVTAEDPRFGDILKIVK